MAAKKKIPIRPAKYSELTSAGSPSPTLVAAVVDIRAVLTVTFEFGKASRDLLVKLRGAGGL